MASPFLGDIRIFSFNFPPKGYAMCNGQILSIQQNAALFSLIGTTYGGNGSTTFALPNLQSRVPLHQGNSAFGTSVLGAVAGEEGVVLGSSQIPSHNHPLKGVSTPATTLTPVNNAMAAGNSNLYASVGNGPVNLAAATVANAGGGQAHENRQPYLVLNVCIAITGQFPSRN